MIGWAPSAENKPMAPPGLEVLFTPLTLRQLTLRNRLVMPGMQRGFMNDGAPSRKMVDYMRRCSAGGVGLIISESTHPDHPSAYWQLFRRNRTGDPQRRGPGLCHFVPLLPVQGSGLRSGGGFRSTGSARHVGSAPRRWRGHVQCVLAALLQAGVAGQRASALHDCGKVRAGRFAELALFNKSVHLAEAVAALEPGFVEESRKSTATE